MSFDRHAVGRSPFFIVAASRSGTTMLRLMLNAHSNLAVPHEMKYFGERVSQHLLEQWRDPALERDAFERIIDEWLREREHAFEEVGFEAVRTTALNAETNFRAPFRAAMETWANHYGKERWGEKTPANLFYADLIADMFPDAQFVHLVRDPRAVVRSMNAIEFFSEDTVINAYNWKEMVTTGLALLTASTAPEQRLTVHYEQLVKAPEVTLRQICTFLGESFEPGMLDFHQSSRSMLPKSVRTPNIQRPVDDDAAVKWKREMSDDEIALVETVCQEPMKWFGYKPVSDRLGLEARMILVVKSLYWMWKKRQHQEKRDARIKYTPFSRFRSERSWRLGPMEALVQDDTA